ncbi:hypothetical protein [Pseudodonghicola flavimaris]|nr:hypothetical protein [Pseudodonghicola flavimaris]
MLTYNIEEGSEQIRAVLLAQASGAGTTEPTPEELEPFHDKYREMRENPCEVSIPFLSEIAEALPASHPRILRDFPKVITLVKTVALLHADSRERDESGAVVATVEDYEQVRQLVEDT